MTRCITAQPYLNLIIFVDLIKSHRTIRSSLVVENLHAQTFLQSSQYQGFLFDPPGGENYGCECHPQYKVASHSRFSGSFPYKRNSYLSGKIKTRVCRVFTDTLIFYLSMLFSRFSLFCFYMLLETVL